MTDLSSASDGELVALLKGADHAAFTEIYERYWEKLYYKAVKKLGDEAEAQESVQDIFFSLWKNRENFQLRENLENYLAVAVKFQVIQRLAKSRRRHVVVQTLVKEAEQERLSGFAAEWNQEDLEILQAKLTQVIDTLPKKCKLVFNMSRNEAYTNKKIAAELGISEKAVEKHVSHALKVLRSNLGHKSMIILLLNQLL
ncbi:RNA polymerase sigma-70 factor (ECF subfamily) [Pedobacter sp. AK017]|uniref:RNA polymerase sigma-70 factor n=1 Tax=Pedobacter sp. AK017 TaxID=2723073 RepID=UPI0016217FC9|nr:RNA polymerase sigma-70 factor [Pedobacter sp. AK017]MBB5440077.1 RNA polymerase sigma-70 factor (ECF subfamily) [Pedobacter sp. AK017]